MDALNSAGQVTLNAEGKQYAGSYQLRSGVITVTLGSASRVIRVGGAIAAPESLARTILRAMVRENGQRADLGRETRDLWMSAHRQ
jgi:hypothetical protein